ncbi:hypothetical protein C0995_003069 [Termitomyces sp. Mi166|nr:hypothetical protein C0995_003069 [Termitomyces sp. Mi166\
MLAGVIVSAMLYGVALLQTFHYFRRSLVHEGTGPSCITTILALKFDLAHVLQVIGVVLIDSMHMILISHSIYYYLITNYFNPPSLALIWSLLIESLFTILYKSYLDTKQKKHSLDSVPRSHRSCQRRLWNSFQYKTFEDLLKINNLTVTINTLSTATNILIAATLCFMLYSARTGFKRSDTIINRLLVCYSVLGVGPGFAGNIDLYLLLLLPWET